MTPDKPCTCPADERPSKCAHKHALKDCLFAESQRMFAENPLNTPDKLDELEALLARHAQGSSDLASRRVCAEALRLIRAQAEEIAKLTAENDHLSKVVVSDVLGTLLEDDETQALHDFIKYLRASKEPS